MTINRVKHFEEIGEVSSRQRIVGFLSLNSLAASDLPNILEMFHSVHGHRSLHHGAKVSYLAMCARYPGHGVSMRIIQRMP